MAIKLFTPCKLCGYPSASFAIGEMTNDEYTTLTCKQGHKTKYFTATPDYPLYFDNGIKAYLDRNYFEAFASLYHSWEQFLSVFIQTILLTELNESYENVQVLIKNIRKNSVQIEGAFNALYALKFGKLAPQMKSSYKSLRNSILHGSRNPEKKDVEKCAMAVYDFIKPIEIEMFLPGKPSEITSLFQIYTDRRLYYLEQADIILAEDVTKGKSAIYQEGQHILGRTPTTSPGNTSREILNFNEIVIQCEAMKKIENTVLNFQSQ